MRRHVTAAVVVAGVLAMVLAGCSDSDGSSSSGSSGDEASSTGSSNTDEANLEPGDLYVALGSSIASGFGISEQLPSCGRSTRNYPRLIAAQFDLELVDVSCGAAVVPHVADMPQGELPLQIAAVTPETKLVTVTIGGNDIGYNGTALGCANPDTVCTARPSLADDLAALPGELQDMVDVIRAAAPDATIVFVTYPREFPDQNCPALNYTDEEFALMQTMGEDLERVFVDVFETNDDVVFVDPYSEPGDHTGCAPPSERWTSGYDAPDSFSYHPTALGHEVMANMTIDALGT